jgi:biopolymer transport protein ExbB
MKKNVFNVIVISAALIVGMCLWAFYFGMPSHFDPKGKPIHILGVIYTGGPIVGILLGLLLTSITYVFERALTISKARGKGDIAGFIKAVLTNLEKGNYEGALADCAKQRGSLANIIRAAIERFMTVEKDATLDKEKKMSEVQRAIDEAVNLETPLLEKNLVIMSTVASISTMFGLLGTTIGMIRAFYALGQQGGGVDASMLAIGISEALYNTAGGLLAAIVSIISYNFFTTMVDNYVYMIDESILNLTQLLTVRVKNQ